MFRIMEKRELCPAIKLFRIHAPLIAKKQKPGHFVILRAHERGERIPLTIVDGDPEEGTITLICQEIGLTTKLLGNLEVGDEIPDMVGPLGQESHIEKFGRAVVLGGGVGIAEALPIARALKAGGNHVISVIGSRTEELLILEQEMREASDELFVTTDDGSYGRKGFVTDVLKELLDGEAPIDYVLAIGPVPMMRAVAKTTEPYGVKTWVSLNPIMVDGTGMCGACRVTVGGETKFACVDGPEFDAHQVDFDELVKRQQFYLDEEQAIQDKYISEDGTLKLEVGA